MHFWCGLYIGPCGRRCCGWGYGICCVAAAVYSGPGAWRRWWSLSLPGAAAWMGLKRGFTAAVVTIAVTAAILALAAVIVWQLIRQAAELLTRLPTLLAGLPGMTAACGSADDLCAACPQGLRAGWRRSPPCWGPRRRCWRSGRQRGVHCSGGGPGGGFARGVPVLRHHGPGGVFHHWQLSRIMAFFRRQLGTRLDRARGVKANLLSTLGKWFRAQAILLGVTFCELLAGFLLMGQRYALLLAAVTALVDALPVFGTGIALRSGSGVPAAGAGPPGGGSCGTVCGDLRCAQLPGAQGHGRPAGLPPAALAAMYAGFRAFGVAGMILLPVALLFVKQLHDQGYVGLWK